MISNFFLRAWSVPILHLYLWSEGQAFVGKGEPRLRGSYGDSVQSSLELQLLRGWHAHHAWGDSSSPGSWLPAKCWGPQLGRENCPLACRVGLDHLLLGGILPRWTIATLPTFPVGRKEKVQNSHDCIGLKGGSCLPCQSRRTLAKWDRRPGLSLPNLGSVGDSALRQKCPTIPLPSFFNDLIKAASEIEKQAIYKKNKTTKKSSICILLWIQILSLLTKYSNNPKQSQCN